MKPLRKVADSKSVVAADGNTANNANLQARGVLQLVRQQLGVHANVPPVELAKAPAKTKRAAALVAVEVPAELQRLKEQYEQEHPGVHLQPVRYVKNGQSGTPFALADLPGEEELVVLAVTETVVSATQLVVRNHMLLAREQRVG